MLSTVAVMVSVPEAETVGCTGPPFTDAAVPAASAVPTPTDESNEPAMTLAARVKAATARKNPRVATMLASLGCEPPLTAVAQR